MMYRFAIGILSCVSIAAIAQQQPQPSPYQPPAVLAQAGVGSPLLLNLSGVTITDQAGQPLGPIQHILLNPSGCVDLAVLSFGGQKLVPIPWRLVSGTGAARGETDVAAQAALSVKVDRTILLQAPSVAINQLTQLSQPQTIQQVHAFFGQHQPATTQTNINVNVGGTIITTNRFGVVTTNILSPTGPTNVAPGRPAFETNRPPFTRPPVAPPPPTTQPPAALPNQPGQPLPNQPGQP